MPASDCWTGVQPVTNTYLLPTMTNSSDPAMGFKSYETAGKFVIPGISTRSTNSWWWERGFCIEGMGDAVDDITNVITPIR